MNRFTTDDQPEILRWAGARIGISSWVPDSQAIAVLDEADRIVAAIVVNTVQDQTAQISIASDGGRRWYSPALAEMFFIWAFYELDLHRLTARIRIANIETQIMVLRLGFQVEGRERAGFFGHDVAVYGMLRDECPFLKEKT